MARLRVTIAAVAATIVFATGCAESPAESATPPRAYESADALVARFNSLAGADFGPDSDLQALLDLLHPENRLQQQLESCAEASLALSEFDRAIRHRFAGAPNHELRRPVFDIAPAAAARIISDDGGRAVAEYASQDRIRRQLHLVRTDDGWRISGATLEYDTEVRLYADVLETYEAMMRWEAPLLEPLAARVRAGAFTSFDAVLEAYAREVESRQKTYPRPCTDDEARQVLQIDLSRKRR